nr:dihydroorotate dehydrogenase (quinone) [Helicobacter enhydrae]
MYGFLKNFIFRFDPEFDHRIAEFLLKNVVPLPLISDCVASQCCFFDESLRSEVLGLRFANPVGLSAGFDKNATMLKGLSTLGFGFAEVGSVTLQAQEGNPKPRIFRFADEESLQNSMGFNNDGAEVMMQRLKALRPFVLPLGVNLGKNKDAQDALSNFEQNLDKLQEVGDFFIFNLSSPNTPNLRDLQNEDFVAELFAMACAKTNKPLLLKICPDNEITHSLKVVEQAIKSGASGIVATNTTKDYSLLKAPKESGGVSGKALRNKSREVFYELAKAFFGKTTLIASGGIFDGEEAYDRIKMGASLVEVYSALIFEGPSVCARINQEILRRLKKDGFSNISEAVGVDL